MPCGIPDQQWPYGLAPIDANNGLRYDTSTGKLWAHPEHVIDRRIANGVHNLISGAVAGYGSGVRIAWSPLYEAAGFAPLSEMQVGRVNPIGVTNTRPRALIARPKLYFPASSWMVGWSMTRCALIARIERDTGSGYTEIATQTVTTRPFRFTQAGTYGPGSFNNNRPLTEESFADSITTDNGLNPLAFDNVTGTGVADRMYFPGFIVDVGTQSTSTLLLQPNETHTYRAWLYARTPDTAIFQIGGGLPDYDYLWSHSTTTSTMRLEVELSTYAPLP